MSPDPVQPLPPVLVISLPSSRRRRDLINAHLTNLGVAFNFLDAIDGNSVPPGLATWYNSERFQAVNRTRPPLAPGELGCALSHLLAWQAIRDGQAPGGFIFEDDAQLVPGTAPRCLQEVAALTRPGEVVLLQSTARYTWARKQRVLASGQHRLLYTMDNTALSSAYYLTRTGAARMLERWEREGITFMSDQWYIRRLDQPSWAGTLPILVAKPDLVTQRVDLPSEVGARGRPGLSGAVLATATNQGRPRTAGPSLRQVLRYLRRGLRRWLGRPACLR